MLEQLLPVLTDGRPSATSSWTRTSAKRVRGFRFLTEKPVLVLLNVGEGEIAEREASWPTSGRIAHRQTMVDALSARIEMEIGELDEEPPVFRDELGLARVEPRARHPASATGCWA